MLKVRILIAIFLPIVLVACSEGSDDVVEYVNTVKKTAGGTIAKLPPEVPPVIEEYTAVNYRSPFDKSLRQIAAEDTAVAPKESVRPDIARTREFLEKYPLDDFVMVGTLMKKNYMWGLLQTKDGMVHAVKVGDYVGQDSGRVTEIAEDRIKLEQTIPNGSGGWMKSDAEIALKSSGDDSDENKTEE